MQPDCTTPPLMTCPKCGREHPATSEFFYRDKTRKSGLCFYCKECTRTYNRTYQAAHPGRAADSKRAWWSANPEYLRAWRAEHPKGGAEYSRTYRAAHPERVAAYRADHAEAIAGYKRADRAAHPEKFAERGRVYVAKHREETAAATRAYRAGHAEDIAAYKKVWSASHSAEIAAYERNRDARKRGNGGTHTGDDVRAQYARQKGRCYWQATDECRDRLGKLGAEYHVDHVMPVILGGYNGPENLVISCPTCNLSKGAKHPQDFCGRLL